MSSGNKLIVVPALMGQMIKCLITARKKDTKNKRLKTNMSFARQVGSLIWSLSVPQSPMS